LISSLDKHVHSLAEGIGGERRRSIVKSNCNRTAAGSYKFETAAAGALRLRQGAPVCFYAHCKFISKIY
jgi:hypothetical protein